MRKSLDNLTVIELKDRLRKKGMPVSGTKDILIARMRSGKKEKTPDNVIDKNLYIKARNKVKKRVKAWPSAYASGQVVTEYKAMGGRYKGSKKSETSSLGRWYKEKWVNVCKPKGRGYAECGREKSKVRAYPYCRPSVRVNSQTPMTVGELKKKYGNKKLEDLCKKKRKEALPKGGKAKRITPKETKRK